MDIKTFAAASALALLAGAAGVGTAAAMPLGSLPDASAVSTDATQVRWVCGPNRCWWRPNYVAPAPYYGVYGPRYRYGWYGRRHHYWR